MYFKVLSINSTLSPPVWLNKVEVPLGLAFFNQNSILKSPVVMYGLFMVAVLLIPLKESDTW